MGTTIYCRNFKCSYHYGGECQLNVLHLGNDGQCICYTEKYRKGQLSHPAKEKAAPTEQHVDVEEIKQWLRERMESLNLTSSEIGADIGLSRITISRFLSDKLPLNKDFELSVALRLKEYKEYLEEIGCDLLSRL